VKHYLEKKGYFVKRSHASKGPFDLLAIKRSVEHPELSRVLLCQCKYGKKGKLNDWEKEELIKIAKQTGGWPISAICKEPRTPIRFHNLLDEGWLDIDP
jgi:hypothetical protein